MGRASSVTGSSGIVAPGLLRGLLKLRGLFRRPLGLWPKNLKDNLGTAAGLFGAVDDRGLINPDSRAEDSSESLCATGRSKPAVCAAELPSWLIRKLSSGGGAPRTMQPCKLDRKPQSESCGTSRWRRGVAKEERAVDGSLLSSEPL